MEYSGEYNYSQDYESSSFDTGTGYPCQYQHGSATGGSYNMVRGDSSRSNQTYSSDESSYHHDFSTAANDFYSAQPNYEVGMNDFWSATGDMDYAPQIKLEPGLYEDAPYPDNTLTVARILAYTPTQLEAAAKAITKNAMSLLANSSFNPLNTQYITPNAIEQRSWGTGTERQAIQEILEEYLFGYLYNPGGSSEPTALLLEEAACQIQWYVEGPQTREICRVAILCALQSLRGDNGSTATEKHQTPAKSSEKAMYVCRASDCKKVFGRSADLDRHEKMIHTEEVNRKSYYCDYKKCPRHKNPFFRQDHYRDHYRDQHYEDLPRRSVRPDEAWWASRTSALGKRWFRCNRCLVQRVDISTYGFSCNKCGHTCEQERQRRRQSAQEESPFAMSDSL